MRWRIRGVPRDRLPSVLDGALESLAGTRRGRVDLVAAPEIEPVGFAVLGAAPRGRTPVAGGQLEAEPPRDRACDVLLDGDDVPHAGVVLLAPEPRALDDVDELGSDDQ